MKKIVVPIVLSLSLFLCSCGKETMTEQNVTQEKDLESVTQENVKEGTAEDSEASEEQIMEAYQQIIQAEQIKISSAEKAEQTAYGFYVFGDINEDGITELMVLSGSSEADETWKCYSYNGDSVYQVGEFSGGHTNLCSGEDGIYTFYGQMGYVEISKIIWDGGTEPISTEMIYSSDTNDLMVEDYDALKETFGLEEMEMNVITADGTSEAGEPNLADEQEMTEQEYEVIPVVEGSYWEGDKSPMGALYYIQISNSTDEGFDFEIFGRDDMEGDFSTVFNYHTAVYTSSDTAVYDGQNYTLTFHWTEQGYLSVDGFPERIPSDDVLYNNDYLGVS